MSKQHYTHLVKIEFNDDPGAYYNGFFDFDSAEQNLEWTKNHLTRQGLDVKSITIVETGQTN